VAKKVSIITAVTICFLIVAGLLAFNISQIPGAQDELSAAQQELAAVQAGLSTAQDKLSSTTGELTDTKADITAALNELAQTEDNLDDTDAELDSTRDNLSQSQSKYKSALNELDKEKSSSAEFRTGIDNTEVNIASLDTGSGYVLNDPTYAEAKAFILADLTNLKTNTSTYTSEDFARDVQLHALEHHIRCANIDVRFGNYGERIVGFNTTDRGMVYFEPQTDEEVILKIGKHYWRECVISKWGAPYQDPTTYVDIVKDWVTIW
jgi:hypothetical protein